MSNNITTNTSTPAYQIDSGAPISTTIWSATGLPEGLIINPETGFITGRPEAVGDYTATITVETEWGSASGERIFHIVVPPFPIISSTKKGMVFPNFKYTYQIEGRTYDTLTGRLVPDSIVEYYLEDEPEGMMLDSETGYIEWNCPFDYEVPSEVNFTVGIKNTFGHTNYMTVTLTVVKPMELKFLSEPEALIYPSDKLIYDCKFQGDGIIDKQFIYDQSRQIEGFSYNPETFDITYDVPLETEPYDLPIHMSLVDKYNQLAEFDLTIKVLDPPSPIMVETDPETIYLDDVYTYQIIGRTINEITGKEVNQNTKYFIEQAPEEMYVDENTGFIVWDIPPDAPRKVEFYAGMTNKYNKTSRILLEINTVIPDDWAPELDDGDEYTCYVGLEIDPYEVTGINTEKNMQ